MPPREPGVWMWAEACELLDRAERLHRQFFHPGRSRARGPSWEPPIDVYETERGFLILVALPGVRPDQLEVLIEDGALVVIGERPIPVESRATLIHRLEIPHGRFERRVPLPAGPLEIDRRELADGCLLLGLRKL